MTNAAIEHDASTALAVHQLMHDATRLRASDIHIEPLRDYCRIRLRIDSLLREHTNLPTWQGTRIITHLKLLAELNIAEKRLPQDGRIYHALTPTKHLSVRISTCPHHLGEKMVLRLFNTDPSFTLNQCGFLPAQLALMQTALHAQSGLILITGPTGSGKTTTLYTALTELNNTLTKNIITIEDPIEMELNGITQVNIHPRIGLTFVTALRSFLRQDPDVILIGEIRDAETAHTAMQAAQTGHLVLASLHTTHAATALSRLHHLGIDHHSIKTHVSLVLAQRLLRKSCAHCSAHPQGCSACYQGYHGQTGVFECLQPQLESTPKLTLMKAGLEKCKQGETTKIELQRVLGSLYALV